MQQVEGRGKHIFYLQHEGMKSQHTRMGFIDFCSLCIGVYILVTILCQKGDSSKESTDPSWKVTKLSNLLSTKGKNGS